MNCVDIVTADGEVRQASDEHNEDLFWAIRGGDRNFRVITSLDFGFHETGPEVYRFFVWFYAKAGTRTSGASGRGSRPLHGIGCTAGRWSRS